MSLFIFLIVFIDIIMLMSLLMFMSNICVHIYISDICLLMSLLMFMSNGYVHVYVIDSVYPCCHRVIVIINVHTIFRILCYYYVNVCVVVLMYIC